MNVYAYVAGHVLKSVDPIGLQEIPEMPPPAESGDKPQKVTKSNSSSIRKWVGAGIATVVVVAAAAHPKTRQMARSLAPRARPILKPAERAARRAKEVIARRANRVAQTVKRWMSSDASRDQTASAGDRVSEITVPNQLSALVRQVSRDVYYVFERANARFSARANLDSKGYIELSLRTKLEDGTRAQVLKGATELKNVLKHFEGRAKGFKANWQYGDKLKVFKDQLAKGLTESQAAWRTWTGQQLKKAGYDQVKILENSGETVKAVFTKSKDAVK